MPEALSLVATGLLGANGNAKLKLAGTVSLPTAPAIDPSLHGVRVRYGDRVGYLMDVNVPGGALSPITRTGWTRNADGTRFSYRGNGISTPITSVALKGSTGLPGRFRIKVAAKGGTFAVVPNELPVWAELIVDSPIASSGQCAVWNFDPPGEGFGCVLRSNRKSLRCN